MQKNRLIFISALILVILLSLVSMVAQLDEQSAISDWWNDLFSSHVDNTELHARADLKIAFIGDQGLTAESKAVLSLIKDERANAVVHAGDFDYQSNPDAWDDMVTSYLGDDFPYLITVGNHDLENNQWPEYQSLIQDRLAKVPGLQCEGDLGVNSSCEYKGVAFFIYCVWCQGEGHAQDIAGRLELSTSPWNICAWHKNHSTFQVGKKPDEVELQYYDLCKAAGALVVTGHEHSYSRTHILSDVFTKAVADNQSPYSLIPGQTIVVVSGLAGHSVREQHRCLPATAPYGCAGEWASIYTATQDAKSGALFCHLPQGGASSNASCYFKNIDEQIIDQFELVVSEQE